MGLIQTETVSNNLFLYTYNSIDLIFVALLPTQTFSGAFRYR
jgi:hypothetical protein